VDREAIFDDTLARLEGRLAALRSGRFDVAGWRSRQLLEGWEVELDLGAERLLAGRVAGYDGVSGALILSVDGTERAIHAGEVTRVVRAVTP
jgi:biotin-(acetyl-CoA carboxylase) ligase